LPPPPPSALKSSIRNPQPVCYGLRLRADYRVRLKRPSLLNRILSRLGRQVILITQNGDDIPFDLRHLRYIHYLNNAEGRAALTAMLSDRLQTLIGH